MLSRGIKVSHLSQVKTFCEMTIKGKLKTNETEKQFQVLHHQDEGKLSGGPAALNPTQPGKLGVQVTEKGRRS